MGFAVFSLLVCVLVSAVANHITLNTLNLPD